MSIVYSEGYRIGLLGLEDLHPFDVNKYQRVAERLAREARIAPQDFIDPGEADDTTLRRVHPEGYLAELRNSSYLARAVEVPLPAGVPAALLEQGLLRPMRRATAGTLVAARAALERGVGINLGGGYHHAHPALGHGFCLYADVGVALHTLLDERKIKRPLIVDLDAHHGDGNAAIFANDERVKILDFYEANNFPYAKLPVWRKVEFGPEVEDDEYLEALRRELPDALEDAEPDLVVYIAGVDVYSHDPLTRFQLTREGIRTRDRFVFEQVREKGIPLLMVLAGGYAPGAWEMQYDTVGWALERFKS